MARGGLSPARLRRLADVMGGYVDRGEVAGAAWAIDRHGEVHAGAVGAQAVGGPPLGRDTIFRVASMTKPVVAVAAMTLVEEARLRLDDPVDRWLPELADRRVLRTPAAPLDDTVPAHRPITLRDLLTSRMGLGLRIGPGLHPIERAMREAGVAPGPKPPAMGPDELMRRLSGLPLMHQPGERWAYHTAFDVLGVLVARAFGTALDAFLAERVLGPLGMRDTGFVVPEAERHRLAACYRAGDGGLAGYDGRGADVTPSGSTGLASTLDDYLAFGRMMLGMGRHGAGRLLARPTVEAMTTDQITPGQKAASPFFPGFWDASGWGLGVSMVTRRTGPAMIPGRFGWTGGLGTAWSSDPREGMVAVVMVQRLWDDVVTALHADFWTLAYQAIDD